MADDRLKKKEREIETRAENRGHWPYFSAVTARLAALKNRNTK